MVRLAQFMSWLTGDHWCEEWTQWEWYKAECERPPADIYEMIRADTTVIHYTVEFQQRQCTICGKIERRRLNRG